MSTLQGHSCFVCGGFCDCDPGETDFQDCTHICVDEEGDYDPAEDMSLWGAPEHPEDEDDEDDE